MFIKIVRLEFRLRTGFVIIILIRVLDIKINANMFRSLIIIIINYKHYIMYAILYTYFKFIYLRTSGILFLEIHEHRVKSPIIKLL